jgi:hypothetical protein
MIVDDFFVNFKLQRLMMMMVSVLSIAGYFISRVYYGK